MIMGKAAHVSTVRLLDYGGSRGSKRTGRLGRQRALVPLMRLESTAGGSLLPVQAFLNHPRGPGTFVLDLPGSKQE
jgi:hypothetical protein